LRFAKASKRFI